MATTISQAQKQALIDNLQLEVTERARKLRAQYASQAQTLRSRLEMRIMRIPQALRKRNMQDLLNEYAAQARPAPPPPVPVVSTQARFNTNATTRGSPTKAPIRSAAKRKSDDISTGDDKENLPSIANDDLANPKKRTKANATTATANTEAVRTASRKVAPGGVLSPKSHNSQTLTRSPIKTVTNAMTGDKTSTIRALQPRATAIAKAPSRAPSRQTKKMAMGNTDSDTGRSSEASTASSVGTTIITKPATKKASAATAKKTATTKAAPGTGGRKPAVAKKEPVPTAAATSGRILRKRI